MTILELLKGKKVKVMTDAKVEVELIIDEVTEYRFTNTVQITPDTPENDWWGTTESHTKVTYTVKFTNGYEKIYSSINDIKII